MSYPLVLSKEELIALRVMVHSAMTHRLLKVARSFRETVLATAPIPAQAESEEDIFVGRINTWLNVSRELDMPLLTGLLKVKDGQSTIVNVDKSTFDSLWSIVNFKYVDEDESESKPAGRIQLIQPALKAAFEVAEANEKTVVEPNLPLADGRN